MKAATIYYPAIGLIITPFLLSCLVLMPRPALAQDSGYPETSERYNRAELSQMLAPIALYPDALLSQLLMASTYPIEVIEADRWLRKNSWLKGEALDRELLSKDWDPSVKAICHFPSILSLMSERISETTSLGNAFLAQEAEVMDVIQELRTRAYARGNLATTAEQTVIVEREVVIIEPAAPRVIFVPYYDPFTIYGPWWYPAYPPWYWAPPGVRVGIGIFYWPGFYFSFVYDPWCYFDWHRHYIFIDVHKRPRFVRHDRWIATPGRWHHAPVHRRGVAYRDKSTARKYGQYPLGSGGFRRDIRGFPERINTDGTRARLGKERTAIDRNRRGRVRSEPLPQRQNRQRIERDRRQEQTIVRDKQARERAERRRQEGKRVEQVRQQTDRERRGWQGDVRPQRQEGRNNVFNRVDDGSRERQSSERGRISRQGRYEDSRGRGRSGDGDSSGRGFRGRNRQ